MLNPAVTQSGDGAAFGPIHLKVEELVAIDARNP
jgi:hypothetical protein